jgi:hypothetical protein
VDTTEVSAGADAERRIAELERRVAELERANEHLWRTNERLGRERLSAQDSAAASIATKLETTEAEVERMRRSLSWRVTTPLRWPRDIAAWLVRRVRPKLRSLAIRLFR